MTSAMQVTVSALARRARLHRNGVVVVSSILLAAPVSALIAWSWRPLVLLIVCLPAVAVMIAIDNWIVFRWCTAVVPALAANRIDVAAFEAALLHQRHLPGATLAGMVATLRAAVGRAAITSESEAILLRRIDQAGRMHRHRTTLVAALSVAVAALAVVWSWMPASAIPIGLP